MTLDTLDQLPQNVDAEKCDWSSDLVTRNGRRFHVRPAQPDDEPALAEFFKHVSKDDIRFRFLTALNTVGHDFLVRMTQVDHDRTEDFLAFGDDGKTIIATAMLAADPELERAEVAISIRADHKDQGISWKLLEHLSRYAEARGIKILESIESRDNHDAIRLEREMGFVATSYPGDATLMLVQKRLTSD
jgi:N-acetylglutamate synthase-like GNAT family acetyltransferase